MKITQIKPSKNLKDLYQIFVDGKFLCSISSTDLLDSKIAEGDEVSQENIDKLLYDSLKGKLSNAVLNYLGNRPHSEKEIHQYLSRKLYEYTKETPEYSSLKTDTIIAEIIEKLKELEYLDDKDFANWLVQQRTNTRSPKSRMAIQAELKAKGIDNETTEEVLAGQSFESEQEKAGKIAQKKLRQLKQKDLDEKSTKNKLSTYLMSKGFTWETVKGAVDSLLPPT